MRLQNNRSDLTSLFNTSSFAAKHRGLRIPLDGREHDSIELPPQLFTGSNLDIYDDVQKFFQVRVKNGRPILQLDRYVGQIPLNDSFFVRIATRVPVKNLERLLGIAVAYNPTFLPQHVRTFDISKEIPTSVLEIITKLLLEVVEEIRFWGPLADYKQRSTRGSQPAGRILPFETAWRSQKAGRPVAVSKLFYRSTNIAPNQLIKAALRSVLESFLQGKDAPSLISGIKSALRWLDDVEIRPVSQGLISESLRYKPRLGSKHLAYEQAFNLAQLILTGHGLDIRSDAQPLSLPSILIDMEKVFEEYSRRLLENGLQSCLVLDGNKGPPNGAKRLMFTEIVDGLKNPPTTPDILIIGGTGSPKLIIDTKYKPSKAVPERADLNQVLAYAVRYGCSKTMVLYSERSEADAIVSNVGKIGDIQMMVGRINLGATDIQSEERNLIKSITALCDI